MVQDGTPAEGAVMGLPVRVCWLTPEVVFARRGSREELYKYFDKVYLH
jgi:hypothetical protein